MITLSRSAIHYAIMKCVETPNYRIVIAVSNKSKIQSVFDYCMEAIEKYDTDRPEGMKSQHVFHLVFENGSSIRCMYIDDGARGNRAHLVIYDQNIDDDTRRFLLGHIESLRE